jgi:biopolymer transport protein ExbB/TolQ
MNAKDFDTANPDLEESIQKEEEELGLLLTRVMSRPLEPVTSRLVGMEKRVIDVNEAMRTVKETTLVDLVGQVQGVEDGLSTLRRAAQQNDEELGEMVTARLDEVRKDISTIGTGHERLETQLITKVEESGQKINAGITALNAQASSATAEKQAADAQLAAAVAMLRTGIDQQNESLKRAMETLAQQLQTQHQASLDVFTAGLAETTKRVGVVQRRVRWFGILGILFGVLIAILTLSPH